MATMTLLQAVTDAMRVEMRRDPDVVVLGEDVGKLGGVPRIGGKGDDDDGAAAGGRGWRANSAPQGRGYSYVSVRAVFPIREQMLKLAQDKRTIEVADQLFRAVGSVHANISEGYSRQSGKDQARFYEYALGSDREARGF